MNPSVAAPSQSLMLSYIAANGDSKEITPTVTGEGGYHIVEVDIVKNLASYECIVCYDIHEKSIQTRCCESMLCAYCYNTMRTPKRYPADMMNFKGSIEEDLKASDRIVNNQVADFIDHFQHLPVSETQHEKSRAQLEALEQLKNSQSISQRFEDETIVRREPSVGAAVRPDSVSMVGSVMSLNRLPESPNSQFVVIKKLAISNNKLIVDLLCPAGVPK